MGVASRPPRPAPRAGTPDARQPRCHGHRTRPLLPWLGAALVLVGTALAAAFLPNPSWWLVVLAALVVLVLVLFGHEAALALGLLAGLPPVALAFLVPLAEAGLLLAALPGLVGSAAPAALLATARHRNAQRRPRGPASLAAGVLGRFGPTSLPVAVLRAESATLPALASRLAILAAGVASTLAWLLAWDGLRAWLGPSVLAAGLAVCVPAAALGWARMAWQARAKAPASTTA